jgi:hypothetical protein
MNRSLRWRIMSLQGILVLVLGFAAGFLFYESSFVTNLIHDQLVAQKISFPDKSQAIAGGALDPAEFPDLQQYAGQQVDSGDKAKAYADGFIGRHLKKVANGMTYSEASAYARANPNDAKAKANVETLFKGEMLRGTLLNAYGWSQVALFSFYAAIGLTVAAGAVFVAFVFEAVVALRREPVTTKPIPSGKAAGVAV